MNNILTDSVSSVRSAVKDPDSLPFLHDLAQEFAKEGSDVFIKAATNIAAVNSFTILNRFDTDALSKRLSEKPELYFQLINSYANLMKASLEQQKFEFRQKQAEARQRERDQKLRARKPILITAATLSAIETSVGRDCPFGRDLREAQRPAGPDGVLPGSHSVEPPSA